MRTASAVLAAICGALLAVPHMVAQTSIGSVAVQNARVQGVVSVSNGRAVIQNNASITAGTDTSHVSLTRGGEVRVCVGSTVALSQSTADTRHKPLLIALQHGAMELETGMVQTDAVLTPDLRIEASDAAALDLRVRVVGNGDTCVENLGKAAPILHVTEQFSGAGYLVKPGQRVLFEHGSVREVVDRQQGNCGCPRGGKDDFPEAVSAGLVQPVVPQAAAAPPGSANTQIATTLDYRAGTPDAAAAANGTPGQAPATVTAPAAASTSQQPKQKSGNPFAAIGRFFRRLFGGS